MSILPNTIKPTRQEHRLLMAALHDRTRGIMTQEELSQLCYKWTVEYAWDDYVWEPLPTVPVKVREWREMDSKIKKALDDRTKAYYTELCRGFNSEWMRIFNNNKDKWLWLKEMQNYFIKTNDKRLERVKQVFEEFSKRLRQVARRPY